MVYRGNINHTTPSGGGDDLDPGAPSRSRHKKTLRKNPTLRFGSPCVQGLPQPQWLVSATDENIRMSMDMEIK